MNDDDTRYIGPTGGDRPRQYFPSDNDPGYQPPQYSYEQPAYQEPPRASKSGGAWPMLLGILFGLTLLAAVAFFFLWRSAAAEADKPVEPTTVTQTTSITVTETTTERALPTDIPTQLPEVPENLPEVDIEGWLNELLGSEPAQ
ncbi:MAG: hypothetical protein Q4G50_04230 [Corynebacterium sp.]|uniref:hypothetical protein n=1 Tax=Corynebacterium sp. TaxID=1720 RepID=UPI0026DFA4C3|nr:hypothetical protein [Corynebacterium sp.]MDO5669186.1 hypothetical protein [Corynebacterium sp.]